MSSALTTGTTRPWWAGTAIDKPIIFLYPLFLFIISLPSILWSLLQIGFATISSISGNIYNWSIFFVVWIFFLSLTVLWEPWLGLYLQIMGPFLQIILIVFVLVVNVLLLIWYIFTDLWNGLCPLLGLMVVYVVQLVMSFFTLVGEAFGELDLTALVADMYEVMWFFVNSLLDAILVVVSVLPVALYLITQIISFVFILLFESAAFLLEWIFWLLTDLFSILFPILKSVFALVRYFSDLLRKKRSIDDTGSRGSGIFFSELWNMGSDVDWGKHADLAHDITLKINVRPKYTMRYGPVRSELHGSHRQYNRGSPDGASSSLPYRALHVRFRQPDHPLWFDTERPYEEHERHVAELSSKKRSTGGVADALYDRQSRMAHVLWSARESMHAGLDALPSIPAQVDVAQRVSTRLCTNMLGFSDCNAALKHYKTKYAHPSLLLEAIIPDVTTHPLGRMMLDGNPEANINDRLWPHEWRRRRSPVSGFVNSRDLNAQLNRYWEGTKVETAGVETAKPETGILDTEVAHPAFLEITSVADCYTTNPRNALCLPEFPPRGWYLPPILFEVPIDLSRDCDVFIAPPNIVDDGTFSVFEYFNPITILWNTLTWLRYLFGFFLTVIFIFDATALRFPQLDWITKIAVWDDPRDVPPNTEMFICMVVFFYYPLTFAFVVYTAAIFLPAIWRGITNAWNYVLAPLRTWGMWRGKLRDWYQENDPRVGFLKLMPSRKVADRFFLMPTSADGAPIALSSSSIFRKDGEVRAGALEYSKHVGASLDNFNSTCEQIIATDLSTLSPSEVLSASVIDPQIEKLRKKLRKKTSVLQRYIHKAHELGLLDTAIDSPIKMQRHRLKFFQGKDPVNTYNMTASYLADVIHNCNVRRLERPEDEFRPLPHPFS